MQLSEGCVPGSSPGRSTVAVPGRSGALAVVQGRVGSTPTGHPHPDGLLLLSSKCNGSAHDSAKVGDQVQLLARALEMTPAPDGRAAACKAASSGFD